MLGLNTNLETGTDLQYKQIVDIFRYDDVMAVREVSGKDGLRRHSPRLRQAGHRRHGRTSPGVAPEGAPDDVRRTIQKKWNGKITFDQGRDALATSTLASEPDAAKTVKVASVPYLMCGGDEYPLPGGDNEKGDELHRRAQAQSDPRSRRCRRPSSISAMAEKAIVEAGTGGIKLP